MTVERSRTGATRRFHVCLHDATPAYAREAEAILADLAPLVGRRLSCGVVPDWHGDWPLSRHPEYCRMIRDAAEERLLHGYLHQRRLGRGPMSMLTGASDEMSGLDLQETRRAIECGRRLFVEAFGSLPQGFLAPGWQRGHVRLGNGMALQLEYVLGFLSLDSRAGRRVPLATWSWDCGRWRWLGHVGQGVGRFLQLQGHRVPVLAIHPRDLERGFWPEILEVTRDLLDRGYEPSTLAALLESSDEVAA